MSQDLKAYGIQADQIVQLLQGQLHFSSDNETVV